MKKQILIIVFSLIFSIIYAQNNEYFGSAIIKKNEYFVRLAGSNLYWSCNKDNTNVQVTGTKAEEYKKIMFIPAGKGFYYIKFLKNGLYLTIKGDIKKGALLYNSKSEQNEAQKYKVISKGGGFYKFIGIKGLAIECNGNRLTLDNNLNKKIQVFEIIRFSNNKKL